VFLLNLNQIEVLRIILFAGEECLPSIKNQIGKGIIFSLEKKGNMDIETTGAAIVYTGY